jgi:hypothetical protein
MALHGRAKSVSIAEFNSALAVLMPDSHNELITAKNSAESPQKVSGELSSYVGVVARG